MDNRNNRKELERSALAFGRQGYKGLLQFLDWRSGGKDCFNFLALAAFLGFFSAFLVGLFQKLFMSPCRDKDFARVIDRRDFDQNKVSMFEVNPKKLQKSKYFFGLKITKNVSSFREN